MLEQFQRFGRDLFLRGLTSSHGGNMSIRMGDRIIITRTGAMLGQLREMDLIETGLEENDSGVMLASSELVVHRAIYRNTSALAIVHVHPPYAVALSLVEQDAIIPIDNEGSYVLHKVPIIQAEFTTGSKEVAKLASAALREYKLVMLRGHGCFSIGPVLEEAYQWCSSLEEASKIIYLSRTLRLAQVGIPALGGAEAIEYRKHTEDYGKW
ncbi:MAG TPA: aldolase [Chloroflexi bacterium]|nr:aldolase [Chloroflexota bacterium]